MRDTPTPDYAAETAFLKRIARGLVFDEAAVDDLVQEVWVTSLGHDLQPRARRAWLARTAQYHAMRFRRDQTSRAKREERHSRDHVPLADDPAERESTRTFLAQQVAHLDDRSAETLRLVYFEQLTLGQVAARLDTPIGTVKARLHRGLVRLRERLLGRYGSGRALGLVLIDAFDWEPEDLEGALVTGSAAASGGTLWSTWLALGLVAVPLALLAWLATGGTGGGVNLAAPPPVPRVEAADVAAATTSPPSAAAGSSARGSAVDRQAAVDGPADPLAVLEVLVTDPDGAPVGDARVHLVLPDGRMVLAGRSGADGRLVVSIDEEDLWPDDTVVGPHVRVNAAAKAWAMSYLYQARVEPGERRPLTITFPAARLDIRGHVVDKEGLPVADALVQIGMGPTPIHTSRDLIVLRGGVGARSDEDGRFNLCFSGEGHPDLIVHAQGYRTARVVLDGVGRQELTPSITLVRGASLRGTVRDGDGRPVGDALVERWHTEGWVEESTRTATDGAYELQGLPAGRQRVWAKGADGAASVELTLAVDEPAQHDFVLSDRHHLRIKPVVEGEGTLQLEGCMAYSATLDWMRIARDVGPEGYLVVEDCPAGVPIHVAVSDLRYRGAVGAAVAAAAGGEPVLVRCTLPDEVAALRGMLSLPSELRTEDAQLLLVPSWERRRYPLVVDRDGRFAALNLVPGRYALDVELAGLGRLPLRTLDLAPGDDRDLGGLAVAAPGRVDVSWSWKMEGLAWRVARRQVVDERIALQTVASGEGAPTAPLALLPGEYSWIVQLPRGPHMRTFVVSSDQVLRVETGPDAPFPVTLELGGTGAVSLVVYAVGGEEPVWHGMARAPARIEVLLPRGPCRLEGTDATGATHQVAFEVGPGGRLHRVEFSAPFRP